MHRQKAQSNTIGGDTKDGVNVASYGAASFLDNPFAHPMIQ
jgi:hypothetical protein